MRRVALCRYQRLHRRPPVGALSRHSALAELARVQPLLSACPRFSLSLVSGATLFPSSPLRSMGSFIIATLLLLPSTAAPPPPPPSLTPVIYSGFTVSLLAGSGVTSSRDGTGSAAAFSSTAALASDGQLLYVVDSVDSLLRVVTVDIGNVTTLAGGLRGSTDGLGSTAQFSGPQGITRCPDGVLYVADTANHLIRRVSAGGNVSTLTGSGAAFLQDGPPAQASFNLPRAIACDATGAALYVADAGEHRLLRAPTLSSHTLRRQQLHSQD